MEVGPYTYPEYDVGGFISYGTTANTVTGVTSSGVNIANAERRLNHTAGTEGDAYEDTQMYLANQAAYSTWWYQNNVLDTQY